MTMTSASNAIDKLREALDNIDGAQHCGDVYRHVDEARAALDELATQLKKAEDVVALARQLGAYDWESRLDDSKTSDDAKRDASELSTAVWLYDQKGPTDG
jgi:hypothetical protein